MIFTHNMEALSNNNIFNFGGWGTVLAFFGIRATSLIEVYPMLTFTIGVFSLIFVVMRVYLTYLETRKVKKEIRDSENKEKT